MSRWTVPLLLTLSFSSAQSQIPSVPFSLTANRIIPPISPSGPFDHVTVGDLTEDATPDAVFFNGSVGLFTYNPDAHTTAVPFIAGPVNWLDHAPDAGVNGGGAIASVGPAGLRLHSISGGVAHVTLVENQTWLDATHVVAASIAGASDLDYAGVAADGQTALLRIDGVISSTPLGNPVIDILPLNYDSDPDLEIAYLTEDGVSILDADGTLLEDYRGWSPGLALARARTGAGLPVRLAWVTANPSGIHKLLRIGVGQSLDPLVTLTTAGSDVLLASGDLDLDGDDDLVVGELGSATLHVYEHNPAASPAFSLVTTITLDEPCETLSIADFDSDGVNDLLTSSAIADEIRLYSGAQGTQGVGGVSPIVTDLTFEGVDGVTRTSIAIDFSSLTTPQVTTHAHVTLWRQVEGPGGTMTSQADCNALYALPPGQETLTAEVGAMSDVISEALCPTTQSTLLPETTFYLTIRPVQVSPGDNIDRAGRTTVLALTMGDLSRAALEGSGGSELLGYDSMCPSLGASTAGNTLLPAGFILPQIPEIPAIPDPGPLQNGPDPCGVPD